MSKSILPGSLVDQNTEILNQIAANFPKVEKLLAIISQISKEIPEDQSIEGGVNTCRREGIRCEDQVSKHQPAECDSVVTELDVQPPSGELNSLNAEPLDIGKTSSLIPKPPQEQACHAEAQEVTDAALGKNLEGTVQGLGGVGGSVQTPPSVPERPITRYDRDRLYEEVWKIPMRTLARQYGVSDTALRQACRRLAVPTPPRGFWNKGAAARQTVARPNLPPAPIQNRRHASFYSERERYSILNQIALAILSGKTLSVACRESGITAKTYRRWYKLKPSSVGPDDSMGEQATSKADQSTSNPSEIRRYPNAVVYSLPQGPPEATETGSNVSPLYPHTKCEEAGRQPHDVTEEGADPSPAIQKRCEVVPIPGALARHLRIHDRKQLYDEVWNKRMSQVAKEYGVSTPTIGTRCRQLHIPTPPPGHWRRLANGLPVQERPPLPEIEIIEEEKKVWKSNKYPPDEIILVSQRISNAVLAGMTQEDACREAGIAITTYRRWGKRLPQPADPPAPPPRRSPVRRNNGTENRYRHHTAEEIADLNQAIEAAIKSEKPLHIALREANISQTTYYRWRRTIQSLRH